MESKSLQLNGASWSVFRMGESAWLIQPAVSDGILDLIHSTTDVLERSKIHGLVDVISAYDSITLIFDSQTSDLENRIPETLPKGKQTLIASSVTYEIEVCYELGLDWKEMEAKSGFRKDEIIEIHSSKEYTIAMTGFLPGFVFLSGLDKQIAVSRKETPRTSVPTGSIGIGGNQTGIYSLESPGGWQIIGRTPQSFFKIDENPPMKMKAGDKIKFVSISENEFIEMENSSG